MSNDDGAQYLVVAGRWGLGGGGTDWEGSNVLASILERLKCGSSSKVWMEGW